ncbi:hypothetical protein [uncultured Odoribacter sp.]|uniref:hypothetical protein n=1 Tax=uncultured Odoribacter sp. TaxID=876416 RepID=UPI002632DE6F|nr:hypothetical protein [uncultured Odoribacter sp.]
MFLIRLIKKLAGLIFPAFASEQKQDCIQPNATETVFLQKWSKRLEEYMVRQVAADMKIRKQEGKNKWIVHAKKNLDAYLLFNAIRPTDNTSVRNTAKYLITSSPVSEGKCFLKLIECKYPFRTKIGTTMKNEILFARLCIETSNGTSGEFKVDFYKETE